MPWTIDEKSLGYIYDCVLLFSPNVDLGPPPERHVTNYFTFFETRRDVLYYEI